MTKNGDYHFYTTTTYKFGTNSTFAELYSGYSGGSGTGLICSYGGSENFDFMYLVANTQTYYLRVRTSPTGSNWTGYLYYYYGPVP
jgi:hypothetical protein